VTLTAEEYQELQALVSKGRSAARKLTHARMPLPVDQAKGGLPKQGPEIADALRCGRATVDHVRKQFVEEGGRSDARSQTHDAHLRTTSGRQGGSTPGGDRLWRAAGGTGTLDVAFVGRSDGGLGPGGIPALRNPAANAYKNELTLWLKKGWCLPDAPSGEFVAAMEDVLDVYQRPYDLKWPVVCMDEASKQLIAEVLDPLPPQPGHIAKCDSEYERTL
jgi:hypothetical protein